MVALSTAAAGIELRDSVVGEHGVITVIETEDHRMLLLDKHVMGIEHLDEEVRHEAAFAGMALMQTIAYLRPRPQAVLCLGLGAGTVPAFLRLLQIRTDVVERDAAVHSQIVRSSGVALVMTRARVDR